MLKTTYILFVIYITAISAFERKGYPDYKYRDDVGGWMKLHDKPANWQTAAETCKKEDAVLIASQFDEVDDILVQVVKESNKNIDYIYVGAQGLSGTRPPIQQEEEVVLNGSKVDCEVLETNTTTKKLVDCNAEYPYICYAPRPEVEDCDFTGAGEDREGFPGYHRCNETGGWVKVHPGPKDYDEAKKKCNEEGGKLIDTDDPKFKDIALKLMKDAKDSDGNPIVIYGKTRITHPNGGLVKKNGKIVHVKNLPPTCSLLFPNGTINHRVGCDQKVGFICHVPFPKEEITTTTTTTTTTTAKPDTTTSTTTTAKPDTTTSTPTTAKPDTTTSTPTTAKPDTTTSTTTTEKPDEIIEDDSCGTGPDKEGNPGYKKCKDVTGWVKVHPDPKDQDEAKKTCEQEGGQLIDPSDPKFKEIALKLTKNNPITIFGKNRKTSNGDGLTKDGGRTKFLKKKPEVCTVVYPNGTVNEEVSCDEKAGFICYIPFEDDNICTGEEKEGNPGYKKCKDVTGWVKVHPDPKDQDEAKKTCDKEGGQLIDLSDPKFKEFVLKLTKNNPITIFGKNRKTGNGDGLTKEGGKTKFLKKKPEVCTVVYPNGTVNEEVSCDEKAGFICYIPFEDDNICTGEGRVGYDGYKGCKDVGGWVKVHPGPNNFKEAKESCGNEGGKLIDLNDPKFKKIALKLIKINSASVFGKNTKKSKDSGLNKVGGKTKFMREDKEVCSILHPNGTIDDEVDCNKTAGFVCYVKFPVLFSCGDGDYIYNEKTASCYKMYSVGKTWSESREQCQFDGGDLVVINSEKEATALQDIYANYDQEFVANHPTHMWAGLVENGPDTWETIEAQTLDDTGYNVWAQSPSKKEINEQEQNCGGVNMLGKYFECSCEVKHGYICEKKITVSETDINEFQRSSIKAHLDLNLDLGIGIFRAQPQPQRSVTRIHL